MSPTALTRLEVRKEKDLAVLRVLPRELDFAQRLAFGEACGELLDSEARRLVVDLTRIERIFSVFVGTLADLALRAEDTGKSLTILARPAVAEVFQRVNLASPLNVRVVEENDASGA